MLYQLSKTADAIRATDGTRTQFWVRIDRNEYLHPFEGWREVLFTDWRRDKRQAEMTFIEAERAVDTMLEWLEGGKATTQADADQAGFIISFKEQGRTLRGQLLVKRAGGGELAEGLKAYIMDGGTEQVRFFLDLDEIDTAEKCNTAFAAAREAAEYLQGTRATYALADGGPYAKYNAPIFTWTRDSIAAKSSETKANAATAPKLWKIGLNYDKSVCKVTPPTGKPYLAAEMPESWVWVTLYDDSTVESLKKRVEQYVESESFTVEGSPEILPGALRLERGGVKRFFVNVECYNKGWKLARACIDARQKLGFQ